MKHLKLLISAICILLPVLASGQGKFYTRKARLEDFPNKTTKVVIQGRSPIELALRSEVTSLWTVSPYEFCSPDEYEKLKEDKRFYFLRFATDDGVAFLVLEKGGKEDDSNRIDRCFEVIRIPISTAGMSKGEDIIFMSAFLQIIQQYTLEAMESDKSGYFGLGLCNNRKMNGKSICIDESAACDIFMEAKSDMLVPLRIAPAPGGTWCYKMLIDAETHELFYFNKVRHKSEGDEQFNEKEIKSFQKRNAEIIG